MRGKLAIGFCVIAAIFCTGCEVNQLTGEDEFMLYSAEEDFDLGRQWAPEVEKGLLGKIPDDGLQRYINRTGQRIARISHRPDWEYHFVAVEDPMINALALPGGYVYITRGLLDKITSEAQLAGILAHEVGHVVARDTAAAMSKETGLNIGRMLAVAATVSGNVDPRVISMTELTGYFFMLSYSREDEKDADMAGLDYMVQAGYNPEGIVQTMQMLQEEQKIRPIEFFSTHPLPENRLYYLRQAIAARHPDSTGLKIGTDEYQQTVTEFLKTHPKPKKRYRQEP